jgi:hypothetical protein
MISKFYNVVRSNYRLALLTFELFWIVVFLLDRVGHGTGAGVPQFVYVNF